MLQENLRYIYIKLFFQAGSRIAVLFYAHLSVVCRKYYVCRLVSRVMLEKGVKIYKYGKVTIPFPLLHCR